MNSPRNGKGIIVTKHVMSRARYRFGEDEVYLVR
jgi:hypothetical protein